MDLRDLGRTISVFDRRLDSLDKQSALLDRELKDHAEKIGEHSKSWERLNAHLSEIEGIFKFIRFIVSFIAFAYLSFQIYQAIGG